MDLGMYFLRARYLNSSTSRFLSEDTFEGEKLIPSSLHKYAYCANESINKIDPSGNMGSYAESAMTVAVIDVLASMAVTSFFIADRGIAAYNGENPFKSDYWYLSFRVDGLIGNYGLGVGGGADLIVRKSTKETWAAWSGELVGNPIGFFSAQRVAAGKLQIAASVGEIYDLTNIQQMSGSSASATWSLRALYLLPKFGRAGVPGWLMYLAHRPPFSDGTGTLGFSSSGPTFAQFTTGRSMGFAFGYSGDFHKINLGQEASELGYLVGAGWNLAKQAYGTVFDETSK